ncbi:MAG TPA: class I SAM-dependent methyltransferase [Vicinamibacterales bacterium]|jgi:2-polyprenyl-3-methyl-5-hydroxy-6-metoxy-1,4-benzoquinol methylase|nr:class I SAM-dependent methyltransferase [Vicinamibacterales bacterium]
MKRLDRQLQRMRIAKVLPYIKPGARVLDVGCADGALYRRAPALSRYVGVDPDAPAEAPGPNARFVRSTFPAQAIDEGEQFDVITALAVLEHVPRDAQAGFANACARHLSANGYLAISVPSPAVDRIIDALKRTGLLDGMREDQHYGFDPTSTPDIFEAHGFRLRHHRRFELGLNHLFVLQRSH